MVTLNVGRLTDAEAERPTDTDIDAERPIDADTDADAPVDRLPPFREPPGGGGNNGIGNVTVPETE